MFYQQIFVFIHLAAMCVCMCVRTHAHVQACAYTYHIELWSVWSVLRDLWWWSLGSTKPVSSIASKQYY